MRYLKALFWMACFLFVIHFSLQNKAEVALRYSFQDHQWFEFTQVPLFLVILCAIFFGVMIGGLGDFYKRFQLRKALRQGQRTIKKLEKEIQALQGSGSTPSSFFKNEE